MNEPASPSPGLFSLEALASTTPQHNVFLSQLSERDDVDVSTLSLLPIDFLVALTRKVIRTDLNSKSDPPCEAAALEAATLPSLCAAPTPSSVEEFHRMFVQSVDCRRALHSVALKRVKLVELCLSLPVWGQCTNKHITAVLGNLQMQTENVRDELVSALLLCCVHYERKLSAASHAQCSTAACVPLGLHGGDKWCEDVFHSLAAFCRVEKNARIMACDGIFHLVMRCLPQCRTHGSQRWCITAAANLCLTDDGRILFVRPEFVAACDWLSRNALHAEVERWLATCVMNILYTKAPPRLLGAPKPPMVSREPFETPDVRDMLIRMAQSSHSRLTPSTAEQDCEAIVQAVTSCFSALVNLAINCHLAEPERLDLCVTPDMLQLMLSFSADSMAEDIIDMVAALMRIMAASQVCKQSFSCVAVRDMFIRLLLRRTPAETKLKLLGALVLLFDNNPVPFEQNVVLFGDKTFRSAVLQSFLAVSSSKSSDDIIAILESVETIKKRFIFFVVTEVLRSHTCMVSFIMLIVVQFQSHGWNDFLVLQIVSIRFLSLASFCSSVLF